MQYLVIEHLTPNNVVLACKEPDFVQAAVCAERRSIASGHVVVVVKHKGGVMTVFPRQERA